MGKESNGSALSRVLNRSLGITESMFGHSTETVALDKAHAELLEAYDDIPEFLDEWTEIAEAHLELTNKIKELEDELVKNKPEDRIKRTGELKEAKKEAEELAKAISNKAVEEDLAESKRLEEAARLREQKKLEKLQLEENERKRLEEEARVLREKSVEKIKATDLEVKQAAFSLVEKYAGMFGTGKVGQTFVAQKCKERPEYTTFQQHVKSLREAPETYPAKESAFNSDAEKVKSALTVIENTLKDLQTLQTPFEEVSEELKDLKEYAPESTVKPIQEEYRAQLKAFDKGKAEAELKKLQGALATAQLLFEEAAEKKSLQHQLEETQKALLPVAVFAEEPLATGLARTFEENLKADDLEEAKKALAGLNRVLALAEEDAAAAEKLRKANGSFPTEKQAKNEEEIKRLAVLERQLAAFKKTWEKEMETARGKIPTPVRGQKGPDPMEARCNQMSENMQRMFDGWSQLDPQTRLQNGSTTQGTLAYMQSRLPRLAESVGSSAEQQLKDRQTREWNAFTQDIAHHWGIYVNSGYKKSKRGPFGDSNLRTDYVSSYCKSGATVSAAGRTFTVSSSDTTGISLKTEIPEEHWGTNAKGDTIKSFIYHL